MERFISDPVEWAMTSFGQTQLRDKRRTRRLVKLAAAMANDPAASIPKQTETWADAKAAYGLFDQDAVTFEAVSEQHWKLRHQCGPGTFLVVSDTTELDFGKNSQAEGLGPTGNGSGRGLLLHSGLLIDAKDGHLLSIAGAMLLCRKPKRKKETSTQRLKRKRESERWGDLIDQIGPAPENARWIHVMDRESDNFEVFCHCQDQGVAWVTRARTMTRRILLEPGGESKPLQDFVKDLPVLSRLSLEVPAKAKTRREPARAARLATLEVGFGTLWLPVPRQKSTYLKQRKNEPIRMQVVFAREINVPPGVEPIEWVLYTSLTVGTLEDVLEVLRIYKTRWTIEEWHKAIKTGTRVTERQLEKKERLAPLIALLSIEAVRLVQLKTVARVDPERLAEEIVPPAYLVTLKRARRLPTTAPLTVRTFFRAVAGLGGFLGRKGDGEPGWQTTWRGWEKLVLMVRGYELAKPPSG
jgi:Transposase DNA-binding/Transposase Tn5 dimerisation domain